MHRDAHAASVRLSAVLHALLVLVSSGSEDDGRVLNPGTLRDYGDILRLAAEAGLLTQGQRLILEEIAARWNHQAPVGFFDILSCGRIRRVSGWFSFP